MSRPGPGRALLLLVSAAAAAVPLAAVGISPRPAAASTADTTARAQTPGRPTAGHPAAGSRAIAGRAGAAALARIRPTARGRLRIVGDLRDGGVVRASGVRLAPVPLPSNEKMLSFAIGYNWRACAAPGRRCRTAADVTATPFAARRYVVGHADTGKFLKVTEFAREVVETGGRSFSFIVLRSSVSSRKSVAVREFARGRRPVAGFAGGLPEHRTGSAEEYFGVSAPHYNAADGAARQRYRVDSGPWRAMPKSHVFFTGRLRVGRHRVAVRTSNRAGRTTLRFGWRVTALTAPLSCTRPAGRPCWYPQHLDARRHPMRWDWQIGRTRPLQRTGRHGVDFYDIDGFLTTRRQIRAIHTRWQASTLAHPKTACYLDLAWEDYRPDASPAPLRRYFPAATLGKVYYGYPQERWLDFRQLGQLKPMLRERISMCARKGFDSVELDDINSFDPASTTGFHLTPGDAQNFLAYAFNLVHRYGMTVLWKNTPGLSWWGRRYTDGAVVEECYIYHECFAASQLGTRQDGITCSRLTGRTPCGWDDFSTYVTAHQPTGKWVGEAEYQQDGVVCSPGKHCRGKRSFATYCRQVYAPPGGFAAVKFSVNLDGTMFFPCPKGT
jgi:Glycoside-hydrolase family GH114